jgi:hypothetical protein
LDASVVYTYLTLNVGPPLGLIKYKKERKLVYQLCCDITVDFATAASQNNVRKVKQI